MYNSLILLLTFANNHTCFEETGLIKFQAVIDQCISKIKTIIANCDAHPNSLLACDDPRFEKYVLSQGKGEGFQRFMIQNPLTLQNDLLWYVITRFEEP